MKTFDSIVVHTNPNIPPKHVVIWLHGLGADGHDFVNMVPKLNFPETLSIKFIFPHAPVRPVTLNAGLPMRAWFDIYGLTASSQIDQAGLDESDQGLKVLLKQEIAQGILTENIILVGFSQGGTLALYTGLTYPKQLGGIMGLSTFFPVTAFETMAQRCQPKNTPIFIGMGEHDTIVSCELSQLVCDYLKEQAYAVQPHIYPMQHTVCAAEIKDIAAWLMLRFQHKS
jgi:phospholipase/carboxylesterase